MPIRRLINVVWYVLNSNADDKRRAEMEHEYERFAFVLESERAKRRPAARRPSVDEVEAGDVRPPWWSDDEEADRASATMAARMSMMR